VVSTDAVENRIEHGIRAKAFNGAATLVVGFLLGSTAAVAYRSQLFQSLMLARLGFDQSTSSNWVYFTQQRSHSGPVERSTRLIEKIERLSREDTRKPLSFSLRKSCWVVCQWIYRALWGSNTQ
jgi:hypothetical protein